LASASTKAASEAAGSTKFRNDKTSTAVASFIDVEKRLATAAAVTSDREGGDFIVARSLAVFRQSHHCS
jgi:hypothetical protein